MRPPPNFKSSAVFLHFPADLSFFNDFTAFRTCVECDRIFGYGQIGGAFAAAVDVSGLCGTGSLFNSSL